jgi:hypothetical protein
VHIIVFIQENSLEILIVISNKIDVFNHSVPYESISENMSRRVLTILHRELKSYREGKHREKGKSETKE